MKKALLFVVLAFGLSLASSVNAQTYKHSLGVRLGSAEQNLSSGFSYRYHFNNKAIEALFNITDPVAVGALFEVFKPFGEANFSWFYGGGGYVGFGKKNNIGATGILGLDYQFKGELPINVSVDWKPELNLLPNVDFNAATVGIGIRFSFNGKKKSAPSQD